MTTPPLFVDLEETSVVEQRGKEREGKMMKGRRERRKRRDWMRKNREESKV